MALSTKRDLAEEIRDDTRTTRSAAVFQKLLSLLLTDQWKEGDRLRPERELCQELGVGRASLREALKALELIGMIDSRVGDGTFVCQQASFLSRPLLWAITGNGTTRVDELVESRLVMECEIAAFAAARATPEDLRAIDLEVHRMGRALTDAEILLDADLKFHLAIAKAGHNQILYNAVQMIRNLMQQWMLVTLHVPGIGSKVVVQHEAILHAIKAKDAGAAREAMRRHLEEMGGLLMRIRSAAIL